MKFAFDRTQIKNHASYIEVYIYIYIYIYIYQKAKSLVVWEGRPDFSFLFKSCEIDRSQGRLVK